MQVLRVNCIIFFAKALTSFVSKIAIQEGKSIASSWIVVSCNRNGNLVDSTITLTKHLPCVHEHDERLRAYLGLVLKT
jgi:hypothetical protein